MRTHEQKAERIYYISWHDITEIHDTAYSMVGVTHVSPEMVSLIAMHTYTYVYVRVYVFMCWYT